MWRHEAFLASDDFVEVIYDGSAIDQDRIVRCLTVGVVNVGLISASRSTFWYAEIFIKLRGISYNPATMQTRLPNGESKTPNTSINAASYLPD